MIVDLFSGVGGWDLGAIELGIKSIGIEIDINAVLTSKAANLNVICKDVRSIPPRVFNGFEGLVGSPPCQTFSRAGNRNGSLELSKVLLGVRDVADGMPPVDLDVNDPRTALVLEPLAWIKSIRPAYVCLEQVPPVLPIWEAYADEMIRWGYSVWTGNLSCERYGIAQVRKRAFLIASLEGPVSEPTPSHSKFYARKPNSIDPNTKKWISMAEALGWGMVQRPSYTLTAGGTDSGGGVELFGNWSRQSMKNCPDWVFKRPSTTVCGDARIGRPGHKNIDQGESTFDNDAVRVELHEAGVLQGFPIDYPWQGPTKYSKFKQVGNAIPPPVAKACIKEASKWHV